MRLGSEQFDAASHVQRNLLLPLIGYPAGQQHGALIDLQVDLEAPQFALTLMRFQLLDNLLGDLLIIRSQP